MKEKKLRKGGLARPIVINPHCDRGFINGTAILSAEEQRRWYDDLYAEAKAARERGEDAFHITMNDAGESRLAPTCMNVPLYLDRAYQVLRARCCPHYSYRKNPGRACVLDPVTGREVYVRRECLEPL